MPCNHDKLDRWRKLWWSLFFVHTVLIAVVCLGPAPAPHLIPRIPFIDKLGHFALFGMQAGLLVMALNPRCNCSLRPLGAVFVCTAYGFFIELLQGQSPVAERTFSMADWVADAVGALVVGWGVAKWVSRFISRRPGGCCSGEDE